MNHIEKILDADGSCRDINFPEQSVEQVTRLLEHISSFSVLGRAYDSEGEELSYEGAVSYVNSASFQGYVQTVWSSEGLIADFQL